MNTILIAVAVVVVLLVVAVFVLKASSEKKAKATYKPPVATAKKGLPEMKEASLPARSEKHLHFCQKCGAANSDQSKFCANCGNKL